MKRDSLLMKTQSFDEEDHSECCDHDPKTLVGSLKQRKYDKVPMNERGISVQRE